MASAPIIPLEIVGRIAIIAPFAAINSLARTNHALAALIRTCAHKIAESASQLPDNKQSVQITTLPNGVRHGKSLARFDTGDIFEIVYEFGRPTSWCLREDIECAIYGHTDSPYAVSSYNCRSGARYINTCLYPCAKTIIVSTDGACVMWDGNTYPPTVGITGYLVDGCINVEVVDRWMKDVIRQVVGITRVLLLDDNIVVNEMGRGLSAESDLAVIVKEHFGVDLTRRWPIDA